MKLMRTYRRILTRRAGIELARLGITVERTVKNYGLEALLIRRLAEVRKALKAGKTNDNFFFLQIGANDGISHDPINAFVCATRVSGIVVEPLPDVFERLCHTYRNHPQIRKLNLAVHEELDRVTMYRPDPEHGPVGHMSGIASFSRDRFELTGSGSKVQSENIVTVEVPAMSLSALLAQERVERLDLLQIDAEGYDMQILKGLDLSRIRPSIISFEHGVNSGVPARDELRESLLRLYDHGYSVAMERVDALAWLHEDVTRKSRRSAA